MSDPLVQELRAWLALYDAGDERAFQMPASPLLERAADALDVAHQREAALTFLLATVKRLLLQHYFIDEALQKLEGVDAAADLRQAAGVRPQGEPR